MVDQWLYGQNGALLPDSIKLLSNLGFDFFIILNFFRFDASILNFKSEVHYVSNLENEVVVGASFQFELDWDVATVDTSAKTIDMSSNISV